ncbi:MAG: metal ABC transporter substrate-binding protein [Planctomycetota bacterium]
MSKLLSPQVRVQAIVALLLLLHAGCERPSRKAPGVTSGTGAGTSAAAAEVLVTHPVLLETARAMTADTDIRVAAALPDLLASRDWRPRAQSIHAMQQAALLVMNGASWEPWTSRVSLPASRLAITSRSFTKELISVPDAVTHQHGPQGRHSHPGIIPSTWLSPTLLEAQADTLQTALLQQFPAHRETLTRNATEWKNALQQPKRLVRQLREATQNQRPAVIADSPLFLYLLRDLDWESTYLAGSETGPAEPEQLTQLRTLSSENSANPRRLFLLSDQRPPDIEQVAVECGLKPLRLDTGLTANAQQSIAQRLAANLERLREVISLRP